MGITMQNKTHFLYPLHNEIISIHDSHLAFENAHPVLFAPAQELLGKVVTIADSIHEFQLTYLEKDGIAMFEIKGYRLDEPKKTLPFLVPVLKPISNKYQVGYGNFVCQKMKELTNNTLSHDWRLDPLKYALLDDLINEYISDHEAALFSTPAKIAVADIEIVDLPEFTSLAVEEFRFGEEQKNSEITIGVIGGKVTATFTTFNEWRSDEYQDSVEKFMFPFPSKLELFTPETLDTAMNKGFCGDAIWQFWENDFGEDADHDEFLKIVADLINPYISYLNGLKQVYAK